MEGLKRITVTYVAGTGIHSARHQAKGVVLNDNGTLTLVGARVGDKRYADLVFVSPVSYEVQI